MTPPEARGRRNERRFRIETEKINERALQIYGDIKGHKGREGQLMYTGPDSTDRLIKEFFARPIPERVKIRLEKTIEFAKEIHEGQTRQDGTPHINHALRAGIRTMDRLAKNSKPFKWYMFGGVDRVQANICHDTQEDGRKEKKLSRNYIRGRFFSYVGQRFRNIRIYGMIDAYDKYDNNGNERPDYDQRIIDEGLASDKLLSDTVDNLSSDMARATTALEKFHQPPVEPQAKTPEELMTDALNQLDKSMGSTGQRLETYRSHLTRDEAIEAAAYVKAGEMFKGDLKTALNHTSEEALA